MSVLHHLEHRVAAFMSPLFVNGHAVPRPLNTPADIRLFLSEIAQVQKNLRLLKTEVNNEKRIVSQSYSDQMAHVSSHPIQGLLEGKKHAIHHSAQDRQHLHHNKNAALIPYQNAIAHLDHHIAILDNLKVQMQQVKQQAQQQAQRQAQFQAQMKRASSGPVFPFTCQFCGFQFQAPGGLVICPRCGR